MRSREIDFPPLTLSGARSAESKGAGAGVGPTSTAALRASAQCERVRLGLALGVALTLAVAACDEKNEGPAPERFASVKAKPTAKASTFCEKTFAPNEKKFVAANVDGTPPQVKGWRWVNLWATWCKPCVEEMGLLLKWREGFEREQVAVTFDLMSIDEPDADLESWRKKNLPGVITRVKSQPDFAAFLEGLGVDKNAAIPIHVLVDPSGSVRCVRVGSIHQENWGAVRALVAGG